MTVLCSFSSAELFNAKKVAAEIFYFLSFVVKCSISLILWWFIQRPGILVIYNIIGEQKTVGCRKLISAVHSFRATYRGRYYLLWHCLSEITSSGLHYAAQLLYSVKPAPVSHYGSCILVLSTNTCSYISLSQELSLLFPTFPLSPCIPLYPSLTIPSYLCCPSWVPVLLFPAFWKVKTQPSLDFSLVKHVVATNIYKLSHVKLTCNNQLLRERGASDHQG